jgi:hypothetical protein
VCEAHGEPGTQLHLPGQQVTGRLLEACLAKPDDQAALQVVVAVGQAAPAGADLGIGQRGRAQQRHLRRGKRLGRAHGQRRISGSSATATNSRER